MRINWGHGIAAVYTIFAAATLWFVGFAVGNPAELVSADYYQRSLDHDRKQAARARTMALDGSLGGEPSHDGKTLIITIPGGEGPATITGEARMYRASSAKDDRVWPIAVDRNGHQTLSTAGLPAGRWVLQLDWRRDGVDFSAERPILLP